jgi:glycerol-3-phosphate dehydrogenase
MAEVAEGVPTAQAAVELLDKLGQLPIFRTVAAVLRGEIKLKEVSSTL